MYSDYVKAGARHGKPDYSNPLADGELLVRSIQLHGAIPLQDPYQCMLGSMLWGLAAVGNHNCDPSNGCFDDTYSWRRARAS